MTDPSTEGLLRDAIAETIEVPIVEDFVVIVMPALGEIIGWRGLTPHIVTHYLHIPVEDEDALTRDADTAGGLVPFSPHNARALCALARADRLAQPVQAWLSSNA